MGVPARPDLFPPEQVQPTPPRPAPLTDISIRASIPGRGERWPCRLAPLAEHDLAEP